ncbi:hypothetical protein ACKFKF_09130 [Phormidesmis sp. 146-12]
MDYDSEAKQRSYLKLLQELGLTNPADLESIDPLILADLAEDATHSQDFTSEVSESSQPNLFKEDMLLKPGEIPAVQDRFHALLKRRLQLEIQQKPPLFPWEKEISDYRLEPASVTSPVFSTASLWMAQLRNLSLPVALPETVLVQLLERCEAVVLSSLREGAKLVKAVDALFPGQTQLLNDVARLVTVAPARSAGTLLPETDLPTSFDDAIEPQQMALSMMAVREILGSLTLTVTPSQPKVDRQWLTDQGLLTLQAEYQLSQGSVRLKVEADLPCGGSLQLQGEEWQALADRPDAGRLNLELRDLSPNKTYPLEVQLGEQDKLVFAISPMSVG